ncbi:ABC transporter permease [Evansella halocellulosilytica]|uniref:ABC transporter permease n=1 Tax=Evansella halocellulosilytica TaxID=2011013 RepID=UPI000BB840E3|nr:ABC transporter permease [Evansella halocellulosilytica]
MKNQQSFTGTWTLLRFMLRRDRIQLPIWILGITIALVGTLAAYDNLYDNEASQQESAQMMASPAAISMTGPEFYLEDYTLGAMMGHQMIGYTAIVVALMSVLLIVRHTRKEEETGRTELVRASVTGRHASSTAALILAVGTNIVLAIVAAIGLASTGAESITWEGSFLFGAALASVGIAFSGLTLFIVQLMENARGAIGISAGMIAVAYTLRAIGDMGEEFLSWLSPIGWAQQTAVYGDNLWSPLLLSVAFAFLFVAIAYPLSTKRDVGAGMLPPRKGKASASNLLTKPIGLAYRLQRTHVIVWSIGIFLLGASYGTFIGEAEAWIDSMGDLAENMLPGMDKGVLADSFAAMFMSVTVVIATIPVLQSILRIRGEEKEGRLEGMLAGALSRYRLLGSYLITAVLNSILILFMAGLGMGLAGSMSMDESRYFGDLILAGLSYAPALWVTVGVALVLIGIIPKAATFSWAVLIFSFLVIYLGGALQMPEWLMSVSPFHHVSRFPIDDLNWTRLLWLTVVAIGLVIIGMYNYRRRDLKM